MMDNKIVPSEKLKDVLITRTAIKTLKSENVVEAVISHQFKEARDAFKKYSEVEVSGFGKFLISKTKIARKILRLEKTKMQLENFLATDICGTPKYSVEQIRGSVNRKLKETCDLLAFLKTKHEV